MTDLDQAFITAMLVSGGLIWYMWSVRRAERRTERVERPGCVSLVILLLALYLGAQAIDVATDGAVRMALVQLERGVQRAQDAVGRQP
jgi:hypothetical protein